MRQSFRKILWGITTLQGAYFIFKDMVRNSAQGEFGFGDLKTHVVDRVVNRRKHKKDAKAQGYVNFGNLDEEKDVPPELQQELHDLLEKFQSGELDEALFDSEMVRIAKEINKIVKEV